MKKILSALLLIIIITTGCNNKLYNIKNLSAQLSHTNKEQTSPLNAISLTKEPSKSYSFVDKNGDTLIINEAVRDDSTGEMVSLRHLNAVTVTAKSQNISERNGIIPISFIVSIPREMQDSDWEVSMLPVLTRGVDTMNFSKILIAGKNFRAAQERGYKRYEKYLKSIIPDSVDFLEVFTDLPSLEIFLERNLPESQLLSGVRNDELTTEMGVSEKKIFEHYIKNWLISRNEKKKKEKDKYFKKYIKNPYLLGARLDSVISVGDIFQYHYTQDIITNEKSSKLYLNLIPKIRTLSGMNMDLKASDTLIYNVSSMVTMLDTTKKYKKKIIQRRVSSSLTAFLKFPTNAYTLDTSLDNNSIEIAKVKKAIISLYNNDDIVLDSISLYAAASPEGAYQHNTVLSQKRAHAVQKFCKQVIDSLEYEEKQIVNIDINGSYMPSKKNVQISSYALSEDWTTLSNLIIGDSIIDNKTQIIDIINNSNLDQAEKELKKLNNYKYIQERIYPKLRYVKFCFDTHRKGMVKDTIHTKEIDSLYQEGISLLKRRKYEEALKVLCSYNDYNTAIAHMSLGHDASAQKILSTITPTAETLYLQAILHSRRGDEENAIQLYLRAKEKNIRIAYRGALDPEISCLISKYNLNSDLFE